MLLNKTTTARAYYGYMNKKLGLSHREIAGKSGKSKKVGLFSRLELSERKLLVFLIVAREILLRSKISRGFLQCSNLWAVHVETNKSEASCLDWRCSMFEISCCASSVKDTFNRKGIEYLYCRNILNIIDDTIRIFFKLTNLILIH